MIMEKGAQARMESPCETFSVAFTGEPESEDNGSSDEFDNKHYGPWPSMRTPD